MLALFAFLCGQFSTASPPKIVVILTDDLGFSDPGCSGSEIETPNLDRLAANGACFTQFYNTAKCHSSRVSLLSGRWCRKAGDTSLRRAEFAVQHDHQWHEVTLQIPETRPLHAFRLDPCAGAGEVRLDGLKITDSAGKVLQQWP